MTSLQQRLQSLKAALLGRRRSGAMESDDEGNAQNAAYFLAPMGSLQFSFLLFSGCKYYAGIAERDESREARIYANMSSLMFCVSWVEAIVARSDPWISSINASVISIPAETPEDVQYLPSTTHLAFLIHSTSGP